MWFVRSYKWSDKSYASITRFLKRYFSPSTEFLAFLFSCSWVLSSALASAYCLIYISTMAAWSWRSSLFFSYYAWFKSHLARKSTGFLGYVLYMTAMPLAMTSPKSLYLRYSASDYWASTILQINLLFYGSFTNASLNTPTSHLFHEFSLLSKFLNHTQKF